VPNFVSFTASNAELAHDCVLNHSLTHPAYLMPREPKLSVWNKHELITYATYDISACHMHHTDKLTAD